MSALLERPVTWQLVGIVILIAVILFMIYEALIAEPEKPQSKSAKPRRRNVDFGQLAKKAVSNIGMQEVDQDWQEIIKDMDVDKADRDSHREFVDDYMGKVHRGKYGPYNNQVASHLTQINPTIGLGRWRAAWVSSRPDENDRQVPSIDLPDLNIGDVTTYQTSYGDMQN